MAPVGGNFRERNTGGTPFILLLSKGILQIVCLFFLHRKKKYIFERVKQHFFQSPPLATRANSYGSTRSIFVHENDTWQLSFNLI